MAAVTSQTTIVRGFAGQPISLPIAGGPATGYQWTLDLPDGVERIDDAPAATVPPEQALGAAAQGAFRVTARAGHHRIQARLARPWDASNPLQSVEIELIVAPAESTA